MKQTNVHAIFDIGKTNKKLFLFDEEGKIAWNTSTTFPTVKDEDGFVADDLDAIESWMIKTMTELIDNGQWIIHSINFSGYGASLAYLDEQGHRLPLFIDYLKPYPEELINSFFENYGPKEKFCRETASPYLGMLNSGLQIYWLKYIKPEWFEEVRYVLHFPQYLSYLFSKTPLAEYTSIGCHTGMWNYQKKDYHRWIDDEGIREILPPIKPSDTWINATFQGKPVRVGTGLHDTSASLIPYLKVEKEPFLLLSTGTWTLSVNPFSRDDLSRDDLENDCLNFLRIDGQQVRTARLFLGREHEIQVNRLSDHYKVNKTDILNLKWDPEAYRKSKEINPFPFEFQHLKAESKGTDQKDERVDKSVDWIEAYYQLMDHLVPLQIEAIQRARGSQDISRLIIEGGFIHNEIFVELLRQALSGWEVRTSDLKGGSARGVYELVHQKDKKI